MGEPSLELPHCNVHRPTAQNSLKTFEIKIEQTEHKDSTRSSNESTALGKISPVDHGFLIFGLQEMSSSCKECHFFLFLAEFSTF